MLTGSNKATIIQFMKRTPERVESGDFPRSWTDEMIDYCHHIIALRCGKEKPTHQHLSCKEYYEANKEKIIQKAKEYYEAHKEEIRGHRKINRDYRSAYDKLRHRRIYKAFRVDSHGPYGSPVRCIETGKIFDNAAEASRSMGLRANAVSNSIHKGGRSGGYHWEYLED